MIIYLEQSRTHSTSADPEVLGQSSETVMTLACSDSLVDPIEDTLNLMNSTPDNVRQMIISLRGSKFHGPVLESENPLDLGILGSLVGVVQDLLEEQGISSDPLANGMKGD